MIGRIVASLTVVLATTFGDASVREDDDPLPVPTPIATRPVAAVDAVDAVDDRELVLSFGDALEALHAELSFEADRRDVPGVKRACGTVLAQYPGLRSAIEDSAMDLLVAAESMVDACRRGFAATLPDDGFAIVDRDYYTYRELSLSLASS